MRAASQRPWRRMNTVVVHPSLSIVCPACVSVLWTRTVRTAVSPNIATSGSPTGSIREWLSTPARTTFKKASLVVTPVLGDDHPLWSLVRCHLFEVVGHDRRGPPPLCLDHLVGLARKATVVTLSPRAEGVPA